MNEGPQGEAPPSPPSPPSEGLSVGMILTRALAPPLVLGPSATLAMLIHGQEWQKPLAVIAVALVAAALVNVAHLSMQLATQPANPPLGMPRVVTGFLLFISLSLGQFVLFLTGFFGGCACLAQLGVPPTAF